METLMAAEVPQQKSWGLARRLTRLLRRKGSSAGSSVAYSVASDVYDESLDSSMNSLSKLKLSGNMAAAYSLDAFFKTAAGKNGVPRQPPVPVPAADAHAFVASLFAGVSAVKASYAQLQLAQHPYDADAIQQGDAALVAELGKLSEHKRRYVRDPAGAVRDAAAGPAAAALADEQRHLIRTYEITARKLDAELRARDAAAERARCELAEELRAARALEERVRPGRNGSLPALDGLHLSGLNPAHFGTALRHAVKSVRSFARSMLDEMRLAGWDVAAAAAAVHPGVPLRRPGDAVFALESYVALKMFAGFHRRDFGLSCLENRGSYDRRRFFEEFADLQSAPAAARRGALGGFLRDRYSSVVHERMEAASFGRQRGAALTETAWFGEFAEMARRVWLLHCLFFAFDGGASIFQARPGERFSEVYMESVSDVDGEYGGGMTLAPAGNRVVGFTVVPGFRVGRSVMQCRVYLSRAARHT
ncbi:protein GRAVITROPIC IN THE LIGHT 1-like [Lolium rigidum]|uniref:protein GRAVITROPIC IN THE LIGHT 1-like n=1 Tax=Lolium rigidum TaxID=89674 RepID=UPI001F5CBB44|nr:protein GRAVITROPIC IN THE LIGHT 1-like [Lolium rigidum]